MSCFRLSAFADEAAAGIDGQIAALERNEIPYIEIRNIDGKCVVDLEKDELRRIGRLLSDHHIGVSAVASPIGKISIEEEMAEHRKRFLQTMDAAEILETNCIRMFSFLIPKNRNADEYKEEVLARLREFTELAEQRGLILCHENEKEIYGERPAQVCTLFNEISSPSFAGIFDPANYLQAGVDPKEAYSLTKDHIRYFHIKDAERESGENVPAGAGDGCIAELLRDAMQSDTIQKPFFLTLEPHLSVFAGYGNLGDSTALGTGKFHFNSNEESFDYACDALKRLLSEL